MQRHPFLLNLLWTPQQNRKDKNFFKGNVLLRMVKNIFLDQNQKKKLRLKKIFRFEIIQDLTRFKIIHMTFFVLFRSTNKMENVNVSAIIFKENYIVNIL